MKRTLSLVLALVMVLGTFSVTFAAEKTVEEKAGEILKTLEVMTGDDAGLRLEDGLKREEAVVMIARLKGQLEVAQNFPTKPTYKDITNKAYEPLLAWAKEDGTFVGHSETKFGFGDNITTQEYASVVLRILGYEVGVEKEITWNDVMAKAEELGLLKNIDAKADFLRGNMAVMTLNALRTNVKDSKETLAEKLELDVPAEEPELSTDIEITAAKAVANNKVEVKVKEEVAASVADFTIVKKGTTTEVEIKDVVKESAKVFVLETEALVSGTSYTVKSNGKALNFTGIAVDKTAPTVKSAKGVDTNTFEVEFSDVMDFASATNVENYTFDKDLKVVSAELSSSRKVVTLTADAAKKNTTYKLTIENLLNSDGVAMKKSSHNVRAVEYTAAPVINGIPVAKSSTLVEVTFSAGTFGMNKESLEKVENYTIDGLEVKEAKAYDLDSDYLYETVLLTTEEQETNKSYKLTVVGVTDDSVLKNVIKTKTLSFRGMRADKGAPTVTDVKAANANEVKITFSDASAMGVASMTDISNYKITSKDGELAILEAKAWAEGYPNAYDTVKGKAQRGVTLTTEEQDTKVTYTIEIKNVEDEYGNAMKTAVKRTFKGSSEDLAPPTVVSVTNTDKGVKIVFNESLNKAIAQDPTNYVINGDIGAAIKATASKTNVANDTVTLTTSSLTANKTYKVTIENIEDEYGNLMPSRTVSFVAISTSLDTTAPSFSYAYAENSNEVHISFDEAIDTTITPSDITLETGFVLKYHGKINNGTTLVYNVKSGTMANKTYTFPDPTNFKDAAGNVVNIKNEVFVGVAGITNEAPEVEYVEQVNVKTVIVAFNEPVRINSVTGADFEKVEGNTANTHVTEWKVKFHAIPAYGKKHTVTFASDDLGGNTSLVKFEYDATYYDDAAPSIVDVEVIDNQTIEITYDKEVTTTGNYKIRDIERKKDIVIANMDYDEDVVTLTLSPATKLEADYLYTLTVNVGAKALNNKVAKNGEWGDFIGTNVEPIKGYITGVSIINANKVKVSANYEMVSVVVYEVYDTDAAKGLLVEVGQISVANKTSATVDLKGSLLDGVTYRVVEGNNKFEFKGVTPDLGLTIESGAVKSYGDAIDTTVYDVIVKDAKLNTVTSYTVGETYYIELREVGATATDPVLYAADRKSVV